MNFLPLLLAAAAQASSVPDKDDARLDQAYAAIKAGRPADALALASAVADDFEGIVHRSQDHCVFSTNSLAQGLIYSTLTSKMKCKDSVVVSGDFSQAYFVKGFALYDLDRMDDAIKAYGQAIALSPLDPHFWLERAETYKSLHRWDKAFSDFETASNDAALGDLDDESVKAEDLARGYRGMAFVKIEQGDLRAARSFLEKAKAAKPGDPRTAADLEDLQNREKR